MRFDIKNMNIWKQETKPKDNTAVINGTDICILSLSVRSFNCLKRAGLNTIGDVIKIIDDEEGKGLKRIRNLGTKSEKEILEKVREYRNTNL